MSNAALAVQATHPTPAQQIDQLLTFKSAAARLNVSVMTLRRWASERPDFPKPKRLGPNCVRFSEREIQNWLVQQ